MQDTLATATIAATTSLLVATAGPWLARRLESRQERRRSAGDVNLRHLAPLRQQLTEAAVRTREVLDRARRGQTDALAVIDDLDDLPTRSRAWFAGDGCYLMSTAWITAALFVEFARVREVYPFLRLEDAGRDAELTARILRIRLALSGNAGVYYATQSAIGADLADGGGATTYQSFIQAVQDPQRAVWYRQLIQLYRGLADQGDPDHAVRLHQLERTVVAMHDLADLLDRAIGSPDSLTERIRSETEEHARRTATT